MSFDLYFYVEKGRESYAEEIERYLLLNGCTREAEFPQWLYENEDTDVYFSFECQLKSEDPEDLEVFDGFTDFDNTDYAFNINLIRPNFFGLEAFPFVEKFMDSLGLYALDPQSQVDPDNPARSNADLYFQEWSRTNRTFSSEYFDELELEYFPLKKSDEYWNYNYSRNRLQEQLGDDYFVPKMMLVREASTGRPITVSTWTENIPNVFPPADYFVLNRKRKKLFREVDESGIISRESLQAYFGEYLEPFEFKGCSILRPEKTSMTRAAFNKLEFQHELAGFFGPGIDLSKLTNAERSPNQKSLDDEIDS